MKKIVFQILWLCLRINTQWGKQWNWKQCTCAWCCVKGTRLLNVADCGYYNIIIMYAFCDVKYFGANQINLWSETIEF